MQLSQTAIVEFQKLAKSELGFELADDEARKYAENFLTVFAIACKPIPSGHDPPPNKGPPSEGRP